MSWPSNSKASNQYTDSVNDLISDARADINQTILNVNTIIDNFAIDAPVDGDLMQYNSGAGAWEPVPADTVNIQKIAVYKGSASSVDLGAGFNPRRYANIFTEVTDAYDLGTVNAGTGEITLQPGTYLFEREHGFGPLGTAADFGFYENDVALVTTTWGGSSYNFPTFLFVRTIASPTNYRIRTNISVTYDLVLKITKL